MSEHQASTVPGQLCSPPTGRDSGAAYQSNDVVHKDVHGARERAATLPVSACVTRCRSGRPGPACPCGSWPAHILILTRLRASSGYSCTRRRDGQVQGAACISLPLLGGSMRLVKRRTVAGYACRTCCTGWTKRVSGVVCLSAALALEISHACGCRCHQSACARRCSHTAPALRVGMPVQRSPIQSEAQLGPGVRAACICIAPLSACSVCRAYALIVALGLSQPPVPRAYPSLKRIFAL